MKIIVAGFSKTGTKSMNAALTELGYEVYDYLEHFMYHGEEWKKILTSGGSVDDFRRMYKDVDAVVDLPAFTFWEEIHWAFPEAKIILTTRDENGWFKSLCRQINPPDKSTLGLIMFMLAPTARRYFRHVISMCPVTMGFEYKSIWSPTQENEMIFKQKYRQHNAYVLQNAPKDKLLVFNVKEGWKPLCEFLGIDVPDKPFPHENVNGEQIEKDFKESKFGKRVQQEIFITISIIICVCAIVAYAIYTRMKFVA